VSSWRIDVFFDDLVRRGISVFFIKLVGWLPGRVLESDRVFRFLHRWEIGVQERREARLSRRREAKCRRRGGHSPLLYSPYPGSGGQCRHCRKELPYRPEGYLAVEDGHG
jgi:hypothetical protein